MDFEDKDAKLKIVNATREVSDEKHGAMTVSVKKQQTKVAHLLMPDHALDS